MAKNSEIKYESELRGFIQKHFPKLTVHPTAIPFISKLLNAVNSRFITEIIAARKKSRLNSAYFAVEKIFPKQMVKLAKSEAMRQLALFEIGSLEYVDGKKKSKQVISAKRTKTVTKNGKVLTKTESAKSKKMKSKQKGKTTATSSNNRPKTVSPLAAFKTGIAKLHHISQSHLILQKDGSQFFSGCLYSFTKTLASRLVGSNPDREIGPVEIRNSLREFLGPNVLRSAISEGNKCLMLHENDFIKFDPKTFIKHEAKLFHFSSEIEGKSFRLGIQGLLSDKFAKPFAMVDNSAEYIEHILLEVSKLFAAEAGGSCLRNKVGFLETADIQIAMEDILPGELKRHATARASKALADYVAETSVMYHNSFSEALPRENRRRLSLAQRSSPTPN